MRRLLPLLVLLLLTAPPARGGEDEIVTALLSWEPGTVGSVSSGRVPFAGAPPAGVEPLPDLRNPHYARIKMAGKGGLLLAFEPDPENPRLWVDHDFDGDLRDETQTSMTAAGVNWFRVQEVLASYPDETGPVAVPLQFMWIPSQGPDFVTVYARIHRRGTVELGGRLRFVALADHSFDAAFDDAARDRIYLDLDGDGVFQVAGDAPEQIKADTPFRVGAEGWTAHVTSASGHAVEFRRTKQVPPEGPRAWIDVAPPTAGIRLAPPAESFEVLRKRFEDERGKPYAERFATVGLLGAVGTRESLELLLDIARTEPDVNLQAAALRGLGNAAYLEPGGDRVLALARKATGSSAYALAQALHQMGHPDREGVYLEMIRSADSNQVGGAARHLAYLDSKKGRSAILDLVRKSGVQNLRYTAYLNGARNLPGGPPLEVILAAADDDYPNLQAEALRDLAKLGHPTARTKALALAVIRPVQFTVGQIVAEVLGTRGDPETVEAMLGLLEDEHLHANVRKTVLEQLRFLRAPESIRVIVKALKAKSPAVRAVAAEVLAGIPTGEVTGELLKRAKKEKDETVLPLLLEALGDHGSETALPLLLGQAKGRKDSDTRRAAIRALARLGFHHPKVRAFLLDLLTSRSEEDRILALDAAASSGDPSLAARILPNLDHDAWPVRLTAVEALDQLRPVAAIAPLIARVGVEEEDRVRDAIAGALFRLTGMNLYDNAEIWQQWWKEHGPGFEVPADVPTLPEQHAGGTQAGFYGIPVKSDRVVFVLDQSGSMSAPGAPPTAEDKEGRNRLDVAVREVLGAVAKLKNRARINVILFHTTIHPWKPTLQPLSGGNRAALASHLETKKPTGGTNLYDGLEMALQTKDVDTIFLLSDGVPGSGKFVSTPDILRAVRRENQTRRIAIHCVSIGMDSDLLRKLAQENGGRYARR